MAGNNLKTRFQRLESILAARANETAEVEEFLWLIDYVVTNQGTNAPPGEKIAAYRREVSAVMARVRSKEAKVPDGPPRARRMAIYELMSDGFLEFLSSGCSDEVRAMSDDELEAYCTRLELMEA